MMPLDSFLKNVADAADGVIGKAKEIGSRTAEAASEGLKSASEKAHQTQHDMRKAYYNPLFPDEFDDPGFDMPNMVVIVDEDERKGIDVCEGSIGWLSKEAGMEVLHLYLEAVSDSGLCFFPSVACDAVYYVDSFDDKRYIDLSSYYGVVQKDKLTELRNIAHALGAKECRLESYEVEKRISTKKGKLSGRGKVPAVARGSVSGEISTHEEAANERSVVFKQSFEGNDEPTVPELKWYKHDAELNSLIEMRCSNSAQNAMKTYEVAIDSLSSSTLSATRAAKIDVALKKLGAVCNFSLEGESREESRKRLIFYLEF